jgi:hypothetical protein
MTFVVRVAALVFALSLAVACSRGAADLGYHQGAGAEALLTAARREAAQDGRQVLVIAGGDWCRWCHVLDRFLHDNPDVESELAKKFVVLKVYYGDSEGDDGTDVAFFDGLPEAEGFPHFWVVRRDGSVRSIETGGLERGDDDYDREKFLRFIREGRVGG